MKNKIIGIFIFVAIGLVLPCYAQMTSIDNGVAWLSKTQNSDGSWGSDLAFIDTAETISTLGLIDNTGAAYTNGSVWLSSRDVVSTDEVSRKIFSLVNTGIDTTHIINTLIAYRNTDGGWGLSSNHVVGNPLDTTFALIAMRAANYADPTVMNSTSIISFPPKTLMADLGFIPAI